MDKTSTIVLISCVKQKQRGRCAAKDLYVSPWFKKAWAYAKAQHPDRIFILSAKHGLLDPEKYVCFYDEALPTTKTPRQHWACSVLEMLKRTGVDLQGDRIIILAAKKYREFLECHLTNSEVPMRHKKIGEQLAWLKQQTEYPTSTA